MIHFIYSLSILLITNLHEQPKFKALINLSESTYYRVEPLFFSQHIYDSTFKEKICLFAKIKVVT